MNPLSFIFRGNFCPQFPFCLFVSGNIELECDEYALAEKCELGELHQIGKCGATISLVSLIKTLIWGSSGIREEMKEVHLRILTKSDSDKIEFKQNQIQTKSDSDKIGFRQNQEEANLSN